MRALGLPDWCIAAGFVRKADVSKDRGAEHEKRLDGLLPGLPWQVRNQARMHVRKDLPQHRDTSDAMTYWLETVTAAARLPSAARGGA